MIKIIWAISLIMALAAVALYLAGCKHYPAVLGVLLPYFLAMMGAAIIVILLMGGTFCL